MGLRKRRSTFIYISVGTFPTVISIPCLPESECHISEELEGILLEFSAFSWVVFYRCQVGQVFLSLLVCTLSPESGFKAITSVRRDGLDVTDVLLIKKKNTDDNFTG